MPDQTTEDATFADVQIDGTDVSRRRFENCTFKGCSAIDCTFTGCEFVECRFKGCRIVVPRSRGSFLSSCVFEDCMLATVDWAAWWPNGVVGMAVEAFDGCTMRLASFSNLDLKPVSFKNASVTESTLDHCGLRARRRLSLAGRRDRLRAERAGQQRERCAVHLAGRAGTAERHRRRHRLTRFFVAWMAGSPAQEALLFSPWPDPAARSSQSRPKRLGALLRGSTSFSPPRIIMTANKTIRRGEAHDEEHDGQQHKERKRRARWHGV